MNSAPPGPLAGITVVDFSRLAPAPLAAMMLGDLGANVLKVEEPGGGQRARDERALKGAAPDRRTEEEVRSRATVPLERNKRSIAVDLHSAEGREVGLALARKADVLIEGFRPGVMSRLGLDYAVVSAVNPGCVYCSITGYGQTGPMSNAVGHDLNYLAYSGALSLIGDAKGTPIVPPNLIADYAGGTLHAVVGIVSALFARTRTGTGQYVDVSMTDGVLALLGLEVASYSLSGVVPRAGATRLTGAVAFYGVYETADGRHMSIACNEPAFFRDLCAALDIPEFVDQQLSGPGGQRRLRDVLERKFKARTLDEWLVTLDPTKIAFAPVHTLPEVLENEHFRARHMLATLPRPDGGQVTQVASAFRLSATPASVRTLPPAPGEHSSEILEELGYSEEERQRLFKSGAVR